MIVLSQQELILVRSIVYTSWSRPFPGLHQKMARIHTVLYVLVAILLNIQQSTCLPTPDLASKISGFLARATQKTVPPNSTLPAPIANLTLKYIALGLGTQNYSCPTSSADAVPTAIGALANLYDTTDAIVGMAAMAMAPVATVSRVLSTITCEADSHDSAAQLNQIGQHYFDAAGTPTFDLSPENLLLKAKKIDASNAPGGACVGRDGGAAVPWLMLQDDGTGRSRGLGQVFRVETAGGSAPPTCEGAPVGTLTRDYAALYYLYG